MSSLSQRLSAVVIFALGSIGIFATSADAALIQYRIDADTSSLAGQTVNLFFAASGYNTGPGSATGNIAVVSHFTSDATLLFPATPFGLTTGDLPSTVNLPFNHENFGIDARAQYGIDAVLGNSISFEISLSGDQLDGSNVVPYAGFEFTLSQNNMQIWLDPSGFASAEVYQLDGVLTTESGPHITVTAVPEPATLSMLGIAAIATGATTRHRRSR